MNGSSPTGGDSASATATATPVFDHHHIGIFWDYENVHLPSHFHNMDAMGVGDKIREALRPYGRMIHEKNVYLDVVDRQCRWQSELQQANFRITNCPTKRTRQNDVIKEVVDKIIISEMWRFAYKTRGLPCLIVLIASDGDYTHTISALRDVGVKVLVWHGGVKATTDRHVDMLTSAADHSAHFIIDILGFVGGGRGPHARGTGGARASFPAPPPTNVASLGARAGAGAGAGATGGRAPSEEGGGYVVVRTLTGREITLCLPAHTYEVAAHEVWAMLEEATGDLSESKDHLTLHLRGVPPEGAIAGLSPSGESTSSGSPSSGMNRSRSARLGTNTAPRAAAAVAGSGGTMIQLSLSDRVRSGSRMSVLQTFMR